jgi:hypothetical protein
MLTCFAFAIVLAAACSTAPSPTATAQPTDAPPTDLPAENETEAAEAPTVQAEMTESAETTDATESGADDEGVVTEESSELETEQAAAETNAEAADSSAEGLVLTSAAAVVSFERTAARSGPGTSFDVVAEVRVNEQYPVYAQTGEGLNTWYLVQLADGSTGWLWRNVVRIEPADAEIPQAENVPTP